ncbi:MAG: putative non-canonical purine NTP phosphatase [candidate division CPR2 bacterium GW2011_GWC2_39_10]|uniref:inosine/xanthosine triphosphatase n=1 Tax=candidate division CPR2 bacterium GW2011_GWC2_39_10 TaxID=1618345 RepID=A0A0G0LZR0_UNCC2|nr:MAG: putative non-canonical purine NTP phosphatase [candidate division CPR2 bacterium GW2011_GWC2_39_10]
MKIILGSENPAKKKAVELALEELGVPRIEIACVDSGSSVSSKPIGFEIIRGAENRNKASKDYAKVKALDYDYLCAIEGGFSLDENGLPFVVTYAIVEDKNGKKSTGKSLGLRLQKEVFDFIKSGGSVNEVIGSLTNSKKNKHDQGVTGFLTNGLMKRDIFDKDAVISAFVPFIFKKERENLLGVIKKLKHK